MQAQGTDPDSKHSCGKSAVRKRLHLTWEQGGEQAKAAPGAHWPAKMNDELQVQGETKVESYRGAHLLPTSGLYLSHSYIYTSPPPPQKR